MLQHNNKHHVYATDNKTPGLNDAVMLRTPSSLISVQTLTLVVTLVSGGYFQLNDISYEERGGPVSKTAKQKHGSLKMASSMPFGPPYNEAANPRAATVRAWLTAAGTTAILTRSAHTLLMTQLPKLNTNIT